MVAKLKLNISSDETTALLQVDSTTHGAIPWPRMTEAQRDAIVSPATGLTVYNTDDDEVNVYNGASWTAFSTATGTVTSVALSAAPSGIFDVSGSPVTGSGTLALSMDNQNANIVLAGPSTGSAATPSFRSLVAADLPNHSASLITSGTLALARGGTNADLSATGPGALIQASNGAAVTVLRHNLAGTTAPTANEDSGDGFGVGSLWVDTTNDEVYMATDVSVGAANWEQLSGGGGGGSDADDITYTPTTLADWDGSSDPGDVEQALDQLAERVTDIEGGATTTSLGQGYIVGFECAYDGTNMTIAAGTARDAADTYNLKKTTSTTINTATTGANALDAGSLGNNQWWYLFMIAKADGTHAGLASQSATSPTMPTDYIYKRRVGAFRTNGSATPYKFATVAGDGCKRFVQWREDTNADPFRIFNNVDIANSTWVDADCSAVVPPTSRRASFWFSTSDTFASVAYRWREKGITAQVLRIGTGQSSSVYELPLDASQIGQIEDFASATTDNIFVQVQGYFDNLLPTIV